ncbi:MAG TPA: nucleotidyltransferase family protein [Methanoregula sp.]|nr:nucleotidyltransferase family protein [Methanoregula sp.]
MRSVSELPVQSADHPSLLPTLRQWHAVHPLAGNPPNALLSVPDDLLRYVIGAVRNIPCSPPVCSPETWDQCISSLHSHRIIPLMASHVLSWPEECRPPEKILSFFEHSLLSGAARNLLMAQQIDKVLTAFQEAGIPVLLIKGPALGRTVYPDPALRQSSDIDLLIRPEDFLSCEKIMERLGYFSHVRTYDISRYAFHHQEFLPKKKGALVEIHWMLDFGFGYFPKNVMDTFFARKIHVQSKDLAFDTLHPADHLQFLIFHNVIHHIHRRLDWIMDVARLTQNFSVPGDWDVFKTSSVAHHIRIPAEIAIKEALLWSGDTLPAGISDFATWPAPSAREERLWKYAKVQSVSPRAHLFLLLYGLPGYEEKLKCCGRFILPPPHLMASYRRSKTRWDPALAHLRRWCSIVHYR